MAAMDLIRGHGPLLHYSHLLSGERTARQRSKAQFNSDRCHPCSVQRNS